MPGTRGERETPSLSSFYILVFAVVLVDQAAKFFALTYLTIENSLPVIPGVFHLTLIYNQGIAFGMFRSHGALLMILISISLVILIVLGHHMSLARFVPQHLPPLAGEERDWKFRHRSSGAAIALILGGAIGNWIDRIRHKAVIDFLDFRVWPVFNLADSAITVGVLLYLIVLLKKRKYS